jgi:alpha-2-macroglobulin
MRGMVLSVIRPLFLIFMLFSAALPVVAQDAVPDRRVAISRDVDFYGADLANIFDTTLDACEAACLANPQCTAFTFNQRSNACFPKAGISQVQPYQGAISGRVLPTDLAVMAQADARTGDLAFLQPYDFERTSDLTRQIGRYHAADENTPQALFDAARERRVAGDVMGAFRLIGAAVSLTDRAEHWLEYGMTGAVAQNDNPNEVGAARERVLPAMIAAYLRAPDSGAQASILYEMALALETEGRGSDMIGALRLAQDIQPRRDTEAALERAIGLYGFRVADTQIDSDSASPRICAIFSERLAQAGVDYAPFVQLPDVAFTVDVADAQLCIDGVEHGQRYRVVLRQGLPSENGGSLARPVELTLYVRDRKPAVRMTNRAYILPRLGDVAIPIETVNLSEVELTLSRVSDRNILRSLQEDLFASPLHDWQQQYFADQLGTEIWRGTARVAEDLNRDVLTRLPLGDVLSGQPAGVYVLQAKVQGAEPWENPAASQWFVLSDLGIATMLGNDGLTVVVRSLADGSAKARTEVTLLSRTNAVLGTAETDDQGVVRFDAGLTRGTGGAAPALVTVADGVEDMAFLSLTDPAFDLSDRGVEGREPSPPIDVFLTTDRGAYRAGEVIHVTALMRDATANALPGVPLTAILTRPDGVEYSRITSSNDAAGGHVFALPVAGSAPRGPWTVAVTADPDAPALARTTVLVEDFLPERIDFDLTVSPVLRLDTIGSLGISARFLFGPPASDLPVEGEVVLSAATSIDGFSGYRFGRHDQPFDRRIETLGADARTGADGNAIVDLTLPQVAGGVSQPLEATLVVRLSEGSGRPVERRLTVPVLPEMAMIGIRPAFGDDVVAEGTDARFTLIGLGPDLSPEPMAVEWTLNRVETRYQWYQLYGEWNWEPTTTRTRVADGSAMLDDTPVAISAPVTWGRYELVVERTDGPYIAASTTFDAGWYVPADVASTPDMLDVSLGAASYAVGDTAMLRVVPRHAGTALISVMADRVIAMQAVDLTEGENVIPLAVTEEWGAGAYVTATLLRPMDAGANRNPARALGLAYAGVDPGPKALDVILDTPIEAAPRERLTVGIDVRGGTPGETAHVTLAAVDVGILNLTAFKSPDPQGYYFGQRKLGVELRDVYGRLIDGMTGQLGSIRSGGDAMGLMGLQSPPPTEELVAYFEGPVTVGQDGRAEVGFDLPAFNGTVRLMAVAWSETGVGQASADVLVRDPVVVTASLPRFLQPGDQSRVLLEIVHAGGPTGEMGLRVQSTGLALATQMIPAAISLGEGERQSLSLPFGAIDPGLHEIVVTLTTPDGKELVKTLALPVQFNDPEVARTTRLTLEPGQTFTFDDNVFAGLRPGSGSSTLSIGPLARFDAAGLLNALDRYPYGCTEQITSQAMPLIWFADVAQAMGLAERDQVPLRISQAITEVLQNQDASGAFGLWGPYSGDMWLDAYVTDFLSRARARGHSVPQLSFDRAMENLRNRVNYYPDFENGGEDLAYALMVLAREGAAAIGDLRYYADERAGAFATPLAVAQVGAALAFYGDQQRADMMFTQAQRMMARQGAEDLIWRADYGSQTRDAAAVLALAVEARSAAVDTEDLALRVSGAGSQVSTQEAVWMLMAADALARDLQSSGITIDGTAPAGPLVRLREAAARVAPVSITNGSATPTEITLTTFGVPSEPEPAGGNGYAISRAYYTMDGTETSPETVGIGNRLVTVLTVQPFGRQSGRLMIDDPLPAGFEIDNPNLLRGGDIRALDWLDPAFPTHAEFRQDRFMAAIDWDSDRSFTLAYIVRAVSPGSFHHAAASVEDMYRPQLRARTAVGRIAVTE